MARKPAKVRMRKSVGTPDLGAAAQLLAPIVASLLESKVDAAAADSIDRKASSPPHTDSDPCR